MKKGAIIAVMLTVSLGTALLLGVKWRQPAIQKAVDEYYDENKFQDFALSYPYGMTQEDLQAVRELEGVSAAEGGYVEHGTAGNGKEDCEVTIRSLPGEISIPVIVDGTLPEAADEAAVEEGAAEALGLSVGDTMSVQCERAGAERLNSEEFRITGIVRHPAHVRAAAPSPGGEDSSGSRDGYSVFMPDTAFRMSIYGESFSAVYVRCDSLRGLNSFGDTYADRAGSIAELLEETGEVRGSARYDAVQEFFAQRIREGEEKIAECEQEIADLGQKVAEGEKKVADAEKSVAEKKEALAAEENAFADREQTVSGVKDLVADGEDTLAEAESQLEAIRDSLQERARNFGLAGDADEEKYDAIADEIASVKEQCRQERQELRDGLSSVQGERTGDVPDQIGEEESSGTITMENLPAGRKLEQWVEAIETAVESSGRGLSSAEKEKDRSSGLLDGNASLKDGYEEAFPDSSGRIKLYLGVVMSLKDARSEFTAAVSELDGAREAVRTAESVLEESRQKLGESRDILEQAEAELDSAEAELENDRAALKDREAELEKEKKELTQVKEAFSQMEECRSWSVEKRADHSGELMDGTADESADKVCCALAAFLLLLAVVICYASVSRMIRKQQMSAEADQMPDGRKRKRRGCVLQAGLAVFLGSALGGALAFFGVERAVLNTAEKLFTVGTIESYLERTDLLILFAAELVLVCAAAWIAGRKRRSRTETGPVN